MAQRVESFDTTCAAGQSVSEDFPFTGGVGEVTRIKVWFPKGCNNLVRARIRYAGGQVIPFDTTKALRGSGRYQDVFIEGYPVGDGWSMGVANDDRWPHTLRTLFFIDEATSSGDIGLPPVVLLPLADF